MCVCCSVVGGFYRDGVILTDPVILSRQRLFGVTDLGADGISTFFHHHTCTDRTGQDRTGQQRQNRVAQHNHNANTFTKQHMCCVGSGYVSIFHLLSCVFAVPSCDDALHTLCVYD